MTNSQTKNVVCLQSENVRRKAKMLKKIPLKPGSCNVHEPYKLEFNKQMWYYSKENEIRRDDICLDYPGGLRDVNQPDKIITFPCHGEKGNQEWIYTKEKQLIHKLSNLCIELNESKQLVMATCSMSNSGQIWNWKENKKSL
ncbi:unnamed protein product [Brachionus calyciflorus]|uniref:Ricin B lectin domain-containing protein n=1 Tax=Brachionus calyciflorus TaxID=104777 RepID=A0A813M3T1_9BILA|nr:unnamed protein product [Brachionus calyciflorus]